MIFFFQPECLWAIKNQQISINQWQITSN